jgi:hypothetical protein
MGRPFAPVAQLADAERYDETVHNPFTQSSTHFEVQRKGEQVVHQARRLAADGRTLYEVQAEAVYAVGSGTRGRSYLVERDGCLYQSPISWFSQKQIQTSSRFPGGTTLRPAHQARMSVLSRQRRQRGPRHRQPLPAAHVPAARHRL